MKLTMLSIFQGIVCKQIYVPNSFFEPCKHLKKERFRLKREMGLSGWTDDHHLIPKCLSKHPALYDIDLNHCKNFKIMPNKRANVPGYIRKHKQHYAYNRYVESLLNTIPVYCQEERMYQLYLLLYHLDSNLNYVGDIPF
jgi:hypothetical protein